jgi:hypothetical protein
LIQGHRRDRRALPLLAGELLMLYAPRPMRFVAIAVAAFLAPSTGVAQATVKPVNDGPNPYRTVEGWAMLPGGRAWGSTSAVARAPVG